MIRTKVVRLPGVARWLVIAGALVITSGAAAEKAKSENKAHKAEGAKGAKSGGKGEKVDESNSAEDRAARRTAEHAAQKDKLRALLRVGIDEPIRQELRRHAERIARLERIKTLAASAKDTDSVDRASKLLDRENERHDKWMVKHAAESKPGAAPAAAAADKKGGTP